MKLTTFILFAALMQVSAASIAQRVTLAPQTLTLKQLFNEINRQTGYNMVWSASQVNVDRQIKVDFNNTPLLEVLDKSLANMNLTYAIENKTVVIKEKEPSLLEKIKTALNLPVSISGKVVDGTGQPMPGVNVREKGTQNGTVTDSKGAFNLTVADNSSVITFSFIGYDTKELTLKDLPKGVVITLKVAENNLREVVINKGYYTDRRELETGDVSTVSAKEIEQQPVGNVLEAMEGRVPGLVINQTTGVPGGAITVQIRGQNSLINGNDPFYVIDGVPYSSQTVNIISNSMAGNGQLYGNNSSAGNPLNYINPADIESISILKDADATSIYGSRAANGAILITTKKGKAGDSRVDFNISSGVGDVTRMMPLLNTQQYLNMRHQAFTNDGVTPDPNSDYDLTFWDTTRNTNWQKVLIGNQAHYDDAQVSTSGGSENTQYLISGGYHRETTVFPGTFADQKASVHANLNNSSLNKKFKISLTANYTADFSNVPSVDLTPQTLLPPDAPPLYNSNGTLNWDPMTPGQAGTWTNPLSSLLIEYKGRTNNLVSNALVSYTLLPGLDISTSLGYTNTQTGEIITFPTSYRDPAFNITSGHSRFNNTNTGSWIIEPQATYALKLGKGLLKALVGGTFEENTTDGQGFSATGFSNDAFLQDIQAASSVTVQSDISTVYKYNALFGRLNYSWEDKYILNATARRDGSSRFGPGKQFANFASVGGAWIFSKENFVQNAFPFISFGKLRASYGTSGNDQIGDYHFLDLYTNSPYPYQNSVGLYPTNLFNPNLAWELNKKLEGGIVLGILKDRITAEVSYYVNRSGNQLVTEPLSGVTGFSSIAANLPAVVQNSGLEVLLNTINVQTGKFRWSTSFNLTEPRNKLISFPDLASSPYANRWVVGQPISIQKVFNYAGVNESTGVYQFTSSNGTTTYNPSYSTDMTGIVNLAPKLYGGFENSFSYKRFQLDILFQFVRQTAPNFNYFIGNPPGFMNNPLVESLNRWQQPGDQKAYQQFTQSYASNAYNASTYYDSSNAVYTVASFIRLKNLAFSYSFPETALHKMHIKNLRIYVNGQNLLTITRYLGLDPESQGLKLPPLKVLVTGIQLSL